MAADPYIVRLAEQDGLLVLARLVELVPDLTAEELSPVQRVTWDRMMATDDLTIYLAEFDGEPVGYTASLQMPHLTYRCRPTVFVESRCTSSKLIVDVEWRDGCSNDYSQTLTPQAATRFSF